MKFDLSKFKKTHEDQHTSTLLHPEGHEIKIAKAGLSPKLRGQLASLPIHRADGGDVPPEVPVSINPTMPEDLDRNDVQNFNQVPSGGDEDSPQLKAPQPSNYNLGVSRSPGEAPIQMPDLTAMYQEPLKNLEKGLNQGVAATKVQADNTQQSAQSYEQSMGDLSAHFNDQMNSLNQERSSLLNDYKAGHIDPSHYWNDKSTAGKVSTAIGLILGGIGGGLTHQENPALKFLNSQIDRDVESQKENLGKKRTLLEANFHQFGNLRDAVSATRVMMGDLYKAKLEDAAAKAATPQAQAAAQQALAEWNLKFAPELTQLGMRQALMKGMQSGGVHPEMAVRFLVPDAQQKDAFKELQTMQNMSKQRDNLMGAFDQLQGINTASNRVFSPFQTPKQVDAIREPLLAQLVKDSEGRITPQDTGMIRPLFPAVGDNDNTIALKRQKMSNFINEKMNFPLLESYGIKRPLPPPRRIVNAPSGYGR